MNWICKNCKHENDSKDSVCQSCHKLRTEDAELIETEADRLIEEYEKAPSPTWTQRMFSASHRIGRLDFLLVLFLVVIAYFCTLVIAVIAFGELSMVTSYSIWAFFILVLMFYGGKRCMDMGFNRWGAIPGIILTIGILVLLLLKGDEGANKYGPSPRKSK